MVTNNKKYDKFFVIFTFNLACFMFIETAGGQGNFSSFARSGSPSSNDPKKLVKIELVPQFNPVTSEKPFALAAILEVQPGWHLYANPKQGEFGIDTEIIPQRRNGIKYGAVIYPAGEKYEDKNLEASNHIYKGKTVCWVPLKVTAQAEEPLRINLEFKGQLCSDTGQCIPWGNQASVEIKITTTVNESKTLQPELFDGFEPASIDWTGIKKSADEPATELSEGPKVVMPDYQPVDFAKVKLEASDWLKSIMLALLAGFLLNLMPCVLPVIPLKVLSLIQQSQRDAESGDRFKAIKLALVFSAGILLVFASLAVVMSVFKILYGQQFQSNTFKFIMLIIIYVLTLSMFGLFEIVVPAKVSNIAMVREGYLGALGMGILATLLATPCSAPMLGPVLTWSLGRPTAITVAVFLVIGFGMASPYVILTAFPKLLHRIPKAGNWMIRLKQGLGVVMLGVTAYLISLFPASWQMPMVIFCLMLALAIWLAMHIKKRRLGRGIALVIVIIGVILLIQTRPRSKPQETENWLVARLLPLHENEQTVMVEFTADWCPNCKLVDISVLKRKDFQDKLKETDTQLVIADWTHNDPAVTEMLNKLGSIGIPFAAIFPGKNPLRPIVLRDIYTLESALQTLDRANKK